MNTESGTPTKTNPIRAWFRRMTQHKGVTGIAFTLSFIFVGLFVFEFMPLFKTLPAPELNLAGEWEVCIPSTPTTDGCAWNRVHVPADIPTPLLTNFQGWAIYRTHFTAPSSCIAPDAACAFFFEEIGDAAEARLNGHVIGRHGQFPPKAVYAKHYPVRLQVSRDSLRSETLGNELMITAYSLKKYQAGVRAPPVGLYSVENSFRLTQTFTTLNVIIPVLCFVALFMMTALAFAVAGPEMIRDPKFLAFICFGLASSCFLLSISEVPREYLPIGLAGYLHFTFRILHDWAFFELVAVYFAYNLTFIRWIRPLYILVLLAFFVQFLIFFVAGFDGAAHTGRGFDVGFLTLKLVLPLLFVPHVMGIYSSWKRRKTWEGQAALMLFGSTFLFQLHDSVIFHGLASGTYYVKWYPLFIGVVFGLFFLDHAREARAKARADQEQARQMKLIYEVTVGLAHDLEEPFKSVEMGFIELQRFPGNQELVKALAETFPEKIKKVYELNRAILRYSKELSTTLELDRQPTDLKTFLEEIADEYRSQPLLDGTKIAVLSNGAAHVQIDQSHMRRVFRNLIRNAAEACAGRSGSKISVEIAASRDGVHVTVSDNGPGISDKILDRLFQPFETYGKENGTGLGLALSQRLVTAHGGEIALVASAVGARFQVTIPGA